MTKSENAKKLAKEEYDHALSLMQYHTQLLWQEFGVFLLAETVLIGFLGSMLAQGNTLFINKVLAFVGAVLGLIICLPWWTTYWHNYKYYELRLAQARRHEKILGISLLTEGKKLSSGDEVRIDGVIIRHPFWSRLFPPRLAVRFLIMVFTLAFITLAILTHPW